MLTLILFVVVALMLFFVFWVLLFVFRVLVFIFWALVFVFWVAVGGVTATYFCDAIAAALLYSFRTIAVTSLVTIGSACAMVVRSIVRSFMAS